MKRIVLILLTICSCCNLFAQKQYLDINSDSAYEQKTIDSIGYNKTHDDAKSVLNEVKLFSEKILQAGYIESFIESNQKINDSTFLYRFKLEKKTTTVHIYVSSKSIHKSLLSKDGKTDTLKIPLNKVESFLQQCKYCRQRRRTG